MLRIAADQSLTQINHKSSRGENCLDLIFTNHPQLVKSPHVTPGISDHDIVVLDSDLKAQGQKTKPRNFFQYKKRDMTGLQEHIQQATDFYMSRIPETEPIGNVWAQFKDIICNAMTKFIPQRQLESHHNLPWITTEIKSGMRRKQRLYNKAKKEGTDSAWAKYRQKISTLERLSVSDNTQQAEILNEQFKSPELEGDPFLSMPELNIEVTIVEKLLQNLNPGKASGPDSVPNRILKLGAKELAPMLTFIFT